MPVENLGALRTGDTFVGGYGPMPVFDDCGPPPENETLEKTIVWYNDLLGKLEGEKGQCKMPPEEPPPIREVDITLNVVASLPETLPLPQEPSHLRDMLVKDVEDILRDRLEGLHIWTEETTKIMADHRVRLTARRAQSS
jgi:hypothetical protein